jgi:hypothetical protein
MGRRWMGNFALGPLILPGPGNNLETIRLSGTEGTCQYLPNPGLRR